MITASVRLLLLVLGVSRQGKRSFFRRSNAIGRELAQALIDRIESLEVHLVGYEDRNPTGGATPSSGVAGDGIVQLAARGLAAHRPTYELAGWTIKART